MALNIKNNKSHLLARLVIDIKMANRTKIRRAKLQSFILKVFCLFHNEFNNLGIKVSYSKHLRYQGSSK